MSKQILVWTRGEGGRRLTEIHPPSLDNTDINVYVYGPTCAYCLAASLSRVGYCQATSQGHNYILYILYVDVCLHGI
jgi:hypothetical protein